MTKVLLIKTKETGIQHNCLTAKWQNLLVILPLCSSLAPTTVYIEYKMQISYQYIYVPTGHHQVQQLQVDYPMPGTCLSVISVLPMAQHT